MRRVLEVGHGGIPLGNPLNADFSRFAAMFPPDTVYHGIDNPFMPSDPLAVTGQLIKNQDIAALETRSRAHPHPRIHLHRMDGRKLAFPDGSFDEAHLHNFVTDPRVSIRDVEQVISEVRRVLAGTGILLLSGDSGASLESKWFATALALQDNGFDEISGRPLKELTAFPDDVVLNISYESGVFMVLDKSGIRMPGIRPA